MTAAGMAIISSTTAHGLPSEKGHYARRKALRRKSFAESSFQRGLAWVEPG
jgi:hypothetical protein